jgi:hypothetical protein
LVPRSTTDTNNIVEPSYFAIHSGARGRWPAWGLILCMHIAALLCCVNNRLPRRQPAPAPDRTLVLLAWPDHRSASRAAPLRLLAPSGRRPLLIKPVPPLPRPMPAPADVAPERPAAPEGAPSRPFDMDAARALARTVAREDRGDARDGSRARALQENPGQDPLGRGIERAWREDCKTKYAGMGLLAIAPLLADGASGSGCKLR